MYNKGSKLKFPRPPSHWGKDNKTKSIVKNKFIYERLMNLLTNLK